MNLERQFSGVLDKFLKILRYRNDGIPLPEGAAGHQQLFLFIEDENLGHIPPLGLVWFSVFSDDVARQ